MSDPNALPDTTPQSQTRVSSRNPNSSVTHLQLNSSLASSTGNSPPLLSTTSLSQKSSSKFRTPHDTTPNSPSSNHSPLSTTSSAKRRGNESPFGSTKRSLGDKVLSSFTIGRGALMAGSAGYNHLSNSPGSPSRSSSNQHNNFSNSSIISSTNPTDGPPALLLDSRLYQQQYSNNNGSINNYSSGQQQFPTSINGDHQNPIHLDFSDNQSRQSHHSSSRSHQSHRSHHSFHSRNSRHSRTSHRHDATLAQAVLGAPTIARSVRSVRFSNQLTISTPSESNKGGQNHIGRPPHNHTHHHPYPHHHSHHPHHSHHQYSHNNDATGSSSSHGSSSRKHHDPHLTNIVTSGGSNSSKNSYEERIRINSTYQQDCLQSFISPMAEPDGYLLPHKDHADDASSVDVNDSDEEHQPGSDILYSPTGHLKYPPSEHLRYEYIRNDAYHYESISCLKMNKIDRYNLVYEQEGLLKRLNSQKALETAYKRQAIATQAPPHTCQMLTTSLNNPVIPEPPIPSFNNDPTTQSQSQQQQQQHSCLGCQFDQENYIPCPFEEEETDWIDCNGLIKYEDKDLGKVDHCCDFFSRSELVSQLHLAVPLIMSFLAQYAVGLVNLSFQGHLDEKSLSAAAIALFFQNISGMALLMGLNSGIDSLGAFAFGAGAYQMVGLVGLRGATISTIASLFVAVMWWFAAIPLVLLGIDADVSQLAQDYCRWCIIALPAINYTDVIRRVLEVQQICIPSMVINGIGLILVVPLNMFFMDRMDYGFIGPAYSFIIINYAMFFALLLYFIASGIGKVCLPNRILSFAIFQGWGPYLSISLPAVGAIAGEWLAFELQIVIGARLGSTSVLGAQSLITSINAFFYNVPMALGIAASCRIGAFMGARKPSAAVLSYHTAIRIVWVSQMMMAATIWVFQDRILRLFTSIDSVIEAAQPVMPMLSLFVVIDGFQGMLQGVLRGCAWQVAGFLSNLFFFWVIALPLSYFLTLHVGTHTYEGVEGVGLGLIGIWCALLVGSGGTLIFYLNLLGFASWTKRANYIYTLMLADEESEMEFADKLRDDDDDPDHDGDNGDNGEEDCDDYGQGQTVVHDNRSDGGYQNDTEDNDHHYYPHHSHSYNHQHSHHHHHDDNNNKARDLEISNREDTPYHHGRSDNQYLYGEDDDFTHLNYSNNDTSMSRQGGDNNHETSSYSPHNEKKSTSRNAPHKRGSNNNSRNQSINLHPDDVVDWRIGLLPSNDQNNTTIEPNPNASHDRTGLLSQQTQSNQYGLWAKLLHLHQSTT